MDSKSKKSGRKYQPETLVLGYGYDPFLSEGSIKPPVFLTSTFQFKTAEDGKAFFEIAHGVRKKTKGGATGLIYSRMNNPNLEILEDRLAAIEGMEKANIFASGMAAIATVVLSFCRPNDIIISSSPIYGGTFTLLHDILSAYGIEVKFHPVGVNMAADFERSIAEARKAGKRVRMFFVESPSNPTLAVADIQAISALAKRYQKADERIYTAVDNTVIGPVFQSPAKLGADIVIYSATKFIGGHSDLVAGVAISDAEIAKTILRYRTVLGTMSSPFDGWLMMRSLETVAIRMKAACENAKRIATFLEGHTKIERVYYPGLLKEGSPEYAIYRRNCLGPGSLMSFDVKGDLSAAYRFLDSLEICKLAVSLGGTESLIQHPASMTHSDMSSDVLNSLSITDKMIRLSVGIENVDDLIDDLDHALKKI